MPYDGVPKSYFAHIAIEARKTVGEDALAANYDNVLAIRWGKGTPLEDPKIRAYLKSYIVSGNHSAAIRSKDGGCKAML
jgi:hypothetical protein